MGEESLLQHVFNQEFLGGTYPSPLPYSAFSYASSKRQKDNVFKDYYERTLFKWNYPGEVERNKNHIVLPVGTAEKFGRLNDKLECRKHGIQIRKSDGYLLCAKGIARFSSTPGF